MKVLLDTSFIVSCIKKRIDFISQLEAQGFRVVVPREVMQELKDFKTRTKSHENRSAVDVALELFEKHGIEKMALGKNIVDDALIAKGKEGMFIATLDNGIKRSVPNRVVIFDSTKSVGAERD
jgi:rRNA-processing protein FCF1